MATIGSTRSIPNPGYNPWTSKVELDTDTGRQIAYVYGGTGKLLYTGTPQEVVSQIPSNTAYNADKAFFDGLISTIDGQSSGLTAQYQQQVPPPKTEPVPAAAESTPNPNKLTGSSDDDSSYDKKAAGEANANSSDNQTTNNIPEITITDERPPKAKSPANVSQKPGIRSFNPLGNFASYTYQLTLYMITPDAYDSFVLSGRKNINVLANESTGGAYIVAQSGGVNNTSSKRAPGFELDYYIDDLKITQATSGNDTQTESNVTTMSFNIYEPYGFSFLSRLRVASEALQQNSKLPNIRQLQNETKQFFILGVRFQGYDIDGNLLPANNRYTFLPLY